jgi:membrane protease subunit HflC
MKILIFVGVLVIFGFITLSTSLYTVDEAKQVIVTRFGDVQDVKTNPGLYLKAPFGIDAITTYEKRVLRIDAPSERMLDMDINVLEIDAYARYKITDAVQFRKTLTSEENARSVLGQRINASLRAVIATRNREQIVGGELVRDKLGNPVVDSDGNAIVIATESRSDILNEVLSRVKANLDQEPEPFGITMMDVRIKRADFPEQVASEIFARMRSDRNKIATRLRSEGEEEGRKIRAAANRDAEVILAEADKESSIRRGDGEAKAINILADALQKDPEFFAFRRSLEAYKTFLGQQDTIVLSADDDLFRFLESPSEK